MSCGGGCRCGSDLVLLWLWHRPAATALIQSLAWKPPYALSAALKRQKNKKNKKKLKKNKMNRKIEKIKLKKNKKRIKDQNVSFETDITTVLQ